jgi:hypothetical protein
MARWVWPTAAGVVTSATGVVINVATDLKTSPWAWVVLVLLTASGVLIAMRVQPAPSPVPASSGGVHNSFSGTVHGPVIQAGSIGSIGYTDRSVNQTATAHENSTIHQAGRDIRSDGTP